MSRHFCIFSEKEVYYMAIISIISLVLAIAAVFISINGMRDQEKLTDQISEILLERVKELIKQDLQTNKKSVKRTKKNDRE